MTAFSVEPQAPARPEHIVPPRGNFGLVVSRFARQREAQLLVAILLLFGVSAALHPAFAASGNISFILADSVSTMIVAVGQTVAILGRGIDLSVSPILGIAAIGVGFPAQDSNLNIFLALVFVLLIGAGLGAANGVLRALIGIPPIIATLATLTIYGGLQFIFSGGQEVVNIPNTYGNLGNSNLLPGIPWVIVIGAAVVTIAYLFLTRTVTGRSIYAVGNNAESAFRAGIPVRTILFLTYVISGMLAGLAGLIYLCHVGSADATTGTDTNVNLYSIAAALIGGTTLLGGRGGPIGGALGAVFLSEALQSMISFHIDPIWEPAGVGVLILIAVLFDRGGAPARQMLRRPFLPPKAGA